MKLTYIAYIFTILIILSQFSLTFGKVTYHLHKRHQTGYKMHHKSKGFLSNLGAFAEGIIQMLAGDNSGLDKCIPAPWKTSKKGDKAEAKIGNHLKSQGGLFKTIVSILKVGITLACKLKSVIMNFLGAKKRLYIRRRHMFIKLDINRHTRIGRKRLFMMLRTKAGKMKLKRWLIGSIVNAVKSVGSGIANAAKAVGNAVVSGAKAVGGAIVKGVKAVGNFVLSGATAIFNGVVSSVKKVWNWFTSFFESPLFKQIKEFVTCLVTGFKAKQLINAIKGFINAIQLLLRGWTGFVKVLVNTLCNWAQFQRAVENLIAAVSKSGRVQWLYFGRFLGRMILAIGGLVKADDPTFDKKHSDKEQEDADKKDGGDASPAKIIVCKKGDKACEKKKAEADKKGPASLIVCKKGDKACEKKKKEAEEKEKNKNDAEKKKRNAKDIPNAMDKGHMDPGFNM